MPTITMPSDLNNLDEFDEYCYYSEIFNERTIEATNSFFNANVINELTINNLFTAWKEALNLDDVDCNILKLENKKTFGLYNNLENKIYINNLYLNKSDLASKYSLFNTILHESRHALQMKRQTNSKLFSQHIQYAFNNYTSADKNIEKYFVNFAELDAREFANKISSETINYLDQKNKKQIKIKNELNKICESERNYERNLYNKFNKKLDLKNKKFYERLSKKYGINDLDNLTAKKRLKLVKLIKKMEKEDAAEILIHLNNQFSTIGIYNRLDNQVISALLKKVKHSIPPEHDKLNALANIYKELENINGVGDYNFYKPEIGLKNIKVIYSKFMEGFNELGKLSESDQTFISSLSKNIEKFNPELLEEIKQIIKDKGFALKNVGEEYSLSRKKEAKYNKGKNLSEATRENIENSDKELN